MKIIEYAYQLRHSAQIDTRLLQRLSHGGVDEGLISLLRPPARKRNVPAPRITLILGALDKKHFRLATGAKAQKDRNCGTSCCGIIDFSGLPRLE